MANRPNWRLFRVPHVTAAKPQTDMPGTDPDTKLPATWLVSNSSIAAKFSGWSDYSIIFVFAFHVSIQRSRLSHPLLVRS